nr:hypothetical protein [Candidatus Pantoea persica]
MPRKIESWKINLFSVWFGCFFTGLAISQIIPFLPLYIEQLGVAGGDTLSVWAGPLASPSSFPPLSRRCGAAWPTAKGAS